MGSQYAWCCDTKRYRRRRRRWGGLAMGRLCVTCSVGSSVLVATSVSLSVGTSSRARLKRGRSSARVALVTLCQIFPRPICRYRFRFQSNLVWNLIKPVCNWFSLQF
jgi:hypothetical protein